MKKEIDKGDNSLGKVGKKQGAAPGRRGRGSPIRADKADRSSSSETTPDELEPCNIHNQNIQCTTLIK